MCLIFCSSVAIILYVICCGFFALFSVGMRYACQVIFVFVAKQTANDDCAKVQLVTKENILQRLLRMSPFSKWRLVERTSPLSQS